MRHVYKALPYTCAISETTMKHWNEVRTAATVARKGTVSAAAQELQIHRATVNRHIEVLESELGAKLFLRSARGYKPTDLGDALLRIADTTHSQFAELNRIAQADAGSLQGVLTVATVDMLVPRVLPAIDRFLAENPSMNVQLNSGPIPVRLEFGEADIAFRVGRKPTDPDYIAVPFGDYSIGLFASKTYVDRRGIPTHPDDLASHDFITPIDGRVLDAPFMRWLSTRIPNNTMRLACDDWPGVMRAVIAGVGIGFVPHSLVDEKDDLVEIHWPQKNWTVKAWRVTHVDLHRSAKVKLFLKVVSDLS